MRTLLSVALLSIFILGTSCENNKSSSKQQLEQKETVQQKDSTPEEKSAAQNKKLKKKVGSIIESQAELKPFLREYGKNNPETKVRLKTSFGDIDMVLYKDVPLHRANFILLIKQDYFNETMIHRVSPGFVIQGGNSDGYETPKKRQRVGNYLIPNEAKAKYSHVRGALSAAKYTEQNRSDASSPFEFFIVKDPNGAHHLDGEHTVFGRVTKGMDVVDKINEVEVDGNEWPKNNIYIDMEIID